MKVHQIMTAHARCVGPDNTLVEAAGLMRELDVGALPVCENDRLAGMVTDRDMVLRGTADGRDPNTTTVREVMSQGVIFVRANQEVEEAAELMEQKQIRRLPVVSRESRLVGIVSLGDIATSSNPAFSGMALREVSEPASPNARQRRLALRSEMAEMPRAEGGRRRPARGGGSRRKTAGGRAASTTKRAAKTGGGNRTRARKSTRTSSRKPSARSRARGGNRRAASRAAR